MPKKIKINICVFGCAGIEVSEMTNAVMILNDQMIFSVQELMNVGRYGDNL